MKLGDMPRFPDKNELETREEKFTAVTVYMSKIVDHLQGNEVESRVYQPRTRDRGRSSQTEISQLKDLLPNIPEEDFGEPGKENE